MKRFILISSILMAPFYVSLAWYLIFVAGKTTGDLGRLAAIPFGTRYEAMISEEAPVSAEKGWVEFQEGVSTDDFDILLLGDSFSDIGEKGFQNYLGNMLGKKILHIHTKGHPSVEAAAGFINSGFFDNRDSTVLIIEIVERNLVAFNKNIDFQVEAYPQHAPLSDEIKDDSGMTLDMFFRWISVNIFRTRRPVKKATLDIDAFSDSKRADMLYFYAEDLARHASVNAETAETVKQNLITLHSMLAEKSVRLIYLVAADKYDVYRKFIKDNRYPEVNTMDYFSDMDDSWFVNSKKSLLSHIEAGEKDVYKLNDSHWSYKGSMIAAEELYNVITGTNKQ